MTRISQLLTIVILPLLILSACGGGGSSTPPTSQAPNASAQISANASEILRGQNITLSWSSTNATSCSASGDWTGSKSSSGTESVTASKDSNNYTITCGNSTASATVKTFLYQVIVTASAPPDYSSAGITSSDFLTALSRGVSSMTFIKGQDGISRVFMFPSLFYNGPTLRAFELKETSDNKFSLVRFFDDVKLGFGRQISFINREKTSSKQFVIVDPGLEDNPDYQLLPHGHVWLATDSGSGFSFSQVSTTRAFYHSVATGDLNGDKRDDIVAMNMGTNDPKGLPNQVYAYLQNADGSFTQDASFAPETVPRSLFEVGSGSVATGDLDGDGTDEIVQANYTSYVIPNWGAFRILKKNTTGQFRITKTFPREGAFSDHNAGASATYLADYDKDGDLDVIFCLEGNLNPAASSGGHGTTNMTGIEIYRNDGSLSFSRVTGSLLTKFVWDTTVPPNPPKDLMWSALGVVDIDNDGYVDLFLQAGGFGVLIGSGTETIDIGSFILKNNAGKGFISMAGTPGLTVKFDTLTKVPKSFRVMDETATGIRVFGFDGAGVPTVIDIRFGK